MDAPVVGAVILTIWLLIWGPIAVLVYRDAVSDGRSRVVALGWAVVVLLLEIFGLIAYKATDWVELD